MSLPFDLGVFGPILQLFVAFVGAYLLAVWISLIVWTFRDVRARSRDLFAQLLSVMLVVIFNIPGLLLYFLLRPHEKLADSYERDLAEEALLQEIEDKQACPVCHQKIQSEFLFCPNCHTKLKRQCENCHHILNLRWTLCPFCGTNVAMTPAATPMPMPPVSSPLP
jgi:RNA polymerase subunit RPABC4/transcription elongation factor Spt4